MILKEGSNDLNYQDAAWRESQRVRLDVNNVFLQQGCTADELNGQAAAAAAAVHAVQQQREALGWPDLPKQDVAPIEKYVKRVHNRIDNFVVLGIGGSALGNTATQTAIHGPYYNNIPRDRRSGPRLFVLDNSDPEMNAGLLNTIDIGRTLFNVISKSGTTAETMASFLLFRHALSERLGEDRIKDHIVLTTDPENGFLRQIGLREGWKMFDLPPKVGGRFSVLTTVGLLSAAMTGVNIRALLAGAAYADELTRSPDIRNNPAALGALINDIMRKKGKNIVVMMPYAQRLKDVADWFAQLWAESLGKKTDRNGQEVRVGTTPVKALGATDQHSQVQLYMEGPFDKLINFLAVERFTETLPIPSAPPAYHDLDGVNYLGGHTFQELIQAEQQGTAIALSEAGQPNMTHIIPEINAFTLGQLFFLFEMQTAIAGELLNINAFDQPGVEAGKINTYALLGRTAYAQRRAEIEARRAQRDAQWIV